MEPTIVDERPLSGFAADTLSSMVDVVVETEKMAAMVAAMRVDQIDKSRRLAELTVRVTTSDGMTPWTEAETARRTLVSELACAMRIPEVSVAALVYESQVLVEQLPATLDALRAGDFSYRHAKIIVDNAMSLPEEQRAEFEAAALTFAGSLTAARFERKAHHSRTDGSRDHCRAPREVGHRSPPRTRECARRDGVASPLPARSRRSRDLCPRD